MPDNPVLGIYPEKHDWKRHRHISVHCSTIYNSQDMEAPTCASTGEWIKKPWYMQTMERYSAIKYAFLNYRFSSDYEHNLENTEKSKGWGAGEPPAFPSQWWCFVPVQFLFVTRRHRSNWVHSSLYVILQTFPCHYFSEQFSILSDGKAHCLPLHAPCNQSQLSDI